MELNDVGITPIATFIRVPCSHLYGCEGRMRGERERNEVKGK